MEDIFTESMEFIKAFNQAKEENGSVESVNLFEKGHDLPVNLEVALMQRAYIDGPVDETPYYKAAGIDQEGNEYEVKWNVVDGWEYIEDEQEMCNWDDPESIDKI